MFTYVVQAPVDYECQYFDDINLLALTKIVECY